jgi:hypothetical protein
MPERDYTARLREPAPLKECAVDDAAMSTNTSIGRGPASGGNENHDGDPTHKTMGETVGQEAPAGVDMPAGVPGAKARPGIAKGEQAFPDGPNVESSPWELDAARGKPHKP